jgi:hypothetical protein
MINEDSCMCFWWAGDATGGPPFFFELRLAELVHEPVKVLRIK